MSDASPRGDGGSILSTLLGAVNKLVRGSSGHADMEATIHRIIGESDRSDDEPLSREEERMLANLLRFGEQRVEDVMVPRADIIAVEIDTPLPALVKLFRDAQHSRLPVYEEELDSVVGMVHLKDLVRHLTDDDPARKPKSIRELKRDVLFVPPSMPVVDLLLKMQARRIHLALVIDEYGGTDGLVSIEDLVEEIVGDIEDEHDTDETPVIVARANGWEADARASLEEFREQTGLAIVSEEEAEEVDTLGGLVSQLAGHVPQRGERIAHASGFVFEIADADARRVKRLRILKPGAADSKARANA